MKKVVIGIIMFGICMGLVIGVVIPVAQQIKEGGQRTYISVRNANNNIAEGP